MSCRRLPLRGYTIFSGSSCLSCSCGGALSIGFAVSMVLRLVFHLVRCFSSGACGFGQLPLPQVACLWILPPYAWPASALVASVGLQPSPCVLSASPAPAGLLGFAGFLHPVSGSSHGGCDCSLGDSVGVALWLPFPLELCFLLCHLLLRFSPSVGAVLCSLLGFPCLGVGALLACGVSGASSLWGLLSRLPLVVGPPSQVSVGPSPALAVGWFGHTSVAPPAAPVWWALVGSLLRCSVALGSCAPYPVGSSLVDSHGFVVQAPGVFLASFLWFFPLASVGYGWLGGCCLRFVQGPLPQAGAVFLTCVSLGGCPSFSQVGPARSHWVPLLWSWCACGLPQFPPPVFSFGMWSPVGSIGSFCPS